MSELGGNELDKALAVICGALKRPGSDKLQEELERALKRRKVPPEQEKAKALFGTPPCRITASTFCLKYGLIQVINRKPPYDKFRETEMSEAALRAVHILVCTAMINEVKARGNPTERQGLHELLLTTLRKFTSPRADESDYNDDDYDDFHGNVDSDVVSSETEDFLLDDVVEFPEDVEDKEDDTSTPTTSTSVVVDAQMQNEEEQHSDVFAKVYRNDRLEIILAVDFRSSADWENLFQPAAYAIGSLSFEHRPPICLQAWDKTTWYYGYLEVDEFLRVENGEIVEETLARFPVTKEAAAASTVWTRSFTQGDVLWKFKEWKKELKRQGMTIPDGEYPVGKVFISQVPNHLPSFFVNYDLTNGARRFYEGVLKTLVGSKVTKWTPNHVYKAYHARKELVDAAMKIGVPKDEWKFVPGLLGELECENWA